MTEYTPYFPKPHQQTLNPIQIVQYANRDLLSIWSESNFQAKLMGIRVLNQAFFIANCPDAVEHILVTHQNNYQKKAAFIDKILHPLIANSSLLNPDIDQQRFQWLENKLFSNQSDNLLSIGIAKFEQSLLNWKQKEFPCQIQIVAELKKFYLNYVYQVLFGNSITDSVIETLITDFQAYQSAIEAIDIIYLTLPEWVRKSQWKSVHQIAQRIHQTIDTLLQQQFAQPEENSVLGQWYLSDNSFVEQNRLAIRDELILYGFAAQEILANTLTWALSIIIDNSEIKSKLIHEANQFNLHSELSISQQLIYTQAFIKEVLRLYPPLPILFHQAESEDKIRQRMIPSGSYLLIVPWLLHRHSDYWIQPHICKPERFLTNTINQSLDYIYLPFGNLFHNQGIQSFCLNNLSITLGLLIKAFNFNPIPTQQLAHECRFILRPNSAFKLQID